MLISVGFRIKLECDGETPLLLALSPLPDEFQRLVGPCRIHTEPELPAETFLDNFGNQITRLVAGPGPLWLRSDCVAVDSGAPDEVDWSARQHPIEELPSSTLGYLAGSRYCEVDLLSADAWRLFGNSGTGWARVQAICDFVHRHITFGYGYARSTKTAVEVFRDGQGVCRDFAHLAITLCRAVNIPARYASGYLGDIGVPPGGPGDFCAWFEVFLGGRWHTFDARYNTPRIGRVLMARGRDAADVPMITSFGSCRLTEFEVWTEEVKPKSGPDAVAQRRFGHRDSDSFSTADGSANRTAFALYPM